ncbi:hypothetical protein CTO_0489 [Chlamydia trachomatis A2497]|uniref:Uncharacterized protein n=1 Tax=Chlamydia trachomatis serovar A (strain A2497) TaxID=580047 RepID=G4NNJ5_CHLT4|nr:hypothetical protein CTO_0489 [Chlamydia trachomatis A2497]
MWSRERFPGRVAGREFSVGFGRQALKAAVLSKKLQKRFQSKFVSGRQKMGETPGSFSCH